MEFEPVGFGERLQAELDRRAWDVKTLQKAVRTKMGKARGTSWGSIWSYVNGHAPIEPRREVMEALAELLGILPHFLMYGDGYRTAVEAAAATDFSRISRRSGAAGSLFWREGITNTGQPTFGNSSGG